MGVGLTAMSAESLGMALGGGELAPPCFCVSSLFSLTQLQAGLLGGVSLKTQLWSTVAPWNGILQ